ncbi:protein FAM219B isoform X5 [Ursus maritimus]|uniref:Protein FAM219B isoform X5 n=1 Tax=Ursus maritimus TaxID=29073 RepID=A0A8M1H3T5_URSMA|nr:protein FAM219B isoform X5 [Ursus maritimus]XP_057159663.1 protein FAM219B isoform X5 [Ursus arctos]
MATADPSGPGVRTSTPGPRPGGTPDCAAATKGLPFGRSGSGVPRLGERPPAVVEKRGPYMVTRAPSIQAKLQKHRDLAKAVLRRKGMLGAAPNRPDSSAKRSVKFNKGYTALSQSPDENLVSLDSDRVVVFGALPLPRIAWLEDSVTMLLFDLEHWPCVGESSSPVTSSLLVRVTPSLLEPM